MVSHGLHSIYVTDMILIFDESITTGNSRPCRWPCSRGCRRCWSCSWRSGPAWSRSRRAPRCCSWIGKNCRRSTSLGRTGRGRSQRRLGLARCGTFWLWQRGRWRHRRHRRTRWWFLGEGLWSKVWFEFALGFEFEFPVFIFTVKSSLAAQTSQSTQHWARDDSQWTENENKSHWRRRKSQKSKRRSCLSEAPTLGKRTLARKTKERLQSRLIAPLKIDI